MDLPEIFFISAVILISLVILITGSVIIYCKINNRSLPYEAIKDMEGRLKDMESSSELNCDEFTIYLEDMTDNLAKIAERILPKEIHISHAATSIEVEERYTDVETQTEQEISSRKKVKDETLSSTDEVVITISDT